MKLSIEARIAEVFRTTGLKCTKQRASILEILLRKESPQTADEIYGKLVEKGLRYNLSTVYRVLEIFLEKGVLDKHVLVNGKGSCYELVHFDEDLNENSKGHSHSIICQECRKVVRVRECPLEGMAAKLMATEGFQVIEHNITIYGKCKKCRKE